MDKNLPHWPYTASTGWWSSIWKHPCHQRLPSGHSPRPPIIPVVYQQLAFADDCILYRRIKKQEDFAILQQDLNKLADWEKKWAMAFHQDKCSTIRISRSRKPVIMDYTLEGHVLETEDYTRYLGVELQSNLSWNRHIDQTVKKANSMLGFLRRNLKVSSEETKTSAYRSMIRPLLEYCSTVWSPHTKEYIQKIEMVQRRAARYVTNRYHNTSSVTEVLDHLEWETLEARRTKNRHIMFFKIIHGLVDIPVEKYVTPASTRTRSRHSLKFRQIPTSSDYYKFSFFPAYSMTLEFTLSQYGWCSLLCTFQKGAF